MAKMRNRSATKHQPDAIDIGDDGEQCHTPAQPRWRASRGESMPFSPRKLSNGLIILFRDSPRNVVRCGCRLPQFISND